MSKFHTTLTFNVTGQELEVYPPSGEVVKYGVPTSVTYAVYLGSQSLEDDPELTGSATVDSVSTTTDAASGYSQTNRKRIYLTATSSIAVGRRYLLANSNGQSEVVTVTNIASADYVDVDKQLANDYASGSTFKGLRLSFTIDADFIADEDSINLDGDPFRVEWRYTVGSLPQRTWTTFDVHRTAQKATVTLTELRGIVPDIHLGEWLDQRGQDFQPQLQAAERDLSLDVRQSGYDPDDIQDPEAYQRLLLQKWAVIIAKGKLFTNPSIGPWFTDLTNDYTNLLNGLVKVAFKVWATTAPTAVIDTDSSSGTLWLDAR